MKYLAILDTDALDLTAFTMTDDNGKEIRVSVYPLIANTVVTLDGSHAYLTQGHINALIEYEEEIIRKNIVERFTNSMSEWQEVDKQGFIGGKIPPNKREEEKND